MNVRKLLLLMIVLAPVLGVSGQRRADLNMPKKSFANVRMASGEGKSVTMKTMAASEPAPVPVNTHYAFATILDGDTIPLYFLKEVDVWGPYMLLTPKEIKKNGKLIRNVKLMLPYAREAKRRLDILEKEVAGMTKKERKAVLKQAEKDIEREYKKDLKKRTYSQGLVLIKLIDRETSRTAYSLVDDLRGSIRAGLYQACARLFGFNLKSKFDPEHDKKDDLIDRIVKSVDRGQL